MSETAPFTIHGKAKLDTSCLVVAWKEDAGKLGPGVTDYLVRQLEGQEFGEIEPAEFFALGGVSVEDDVAQFPESRFYSCPKAGLAILLSDAPRSDWYRFLNSVLDVAEYHCHARELYAIGGMVYFGPHTAPRQLFAVANGEEMRDVMGQYDLARDFDYETPPGQRPTLNSFLLWVAKGRGLPAAGLWVPAPFYLAGTEDPEAWRKTLEFLDRRLGLAIDFSEIDEGVARQDDKLARLRFNSAEIDSCIQKLESNLTLTEEEHETLTRVVQEYLRD